MYNNFLLFSEIFILLEIRKMDIKDSLFYILSTASNADFTTIKMFTRKCLLDSFYLKVIHKRT